MHTHMNSHTLASSDRVPHTQGTGLGVGAGVSGALGAGLGGAFGPVMGVHSGVSNSVKVSSTAGVVSGDVSSTNTLKSEYRLMVHQLRDRYEAERYKLGMQHREELNKLVRVMMCTHTHTQTAAPTCSLRRVISTPSCNFHLNV